MNAPDARVRQNRLTLLNTLLTEFSTIADFSEIVTTFIGDTATHEESTFTSFGGGTADGDGKMKDMLGGKGAGLAEMSRAGVPVPPGFTISTDVCNIFFENDNKVPDEVDEQIWQALDEARKADRARSSATPPIRCCSACAPARSSPCPA